MSQVFAGLSPEMLAGADRPPSPPAFFPWLRACAAGLFAIAGVLMIATHLDFERPYTTSVFQETEVEIIRERNAVYQVGGALIVLASLALFTLLELLAMAWNGQARATSRPPADPDFDAGSAHAVLPEAAVWPPTADGVLELPDAG